MARKPEIQRLKTVDLPGPPPASTAALRATRVPPPPGGGSWLFDPVTGEFSPLPAQRRDERKAPAQSKEA